MKINNTIVLLYRKIAFGILASFLMGVIVYVGLVFFYLVSTSWAAPIVLSPSQERVLAFQPEIASLQAGLNKQKIELATARATVSALSAQTVQISSLMKRIDGAIGVESAELTSASKAIDQVLAAKRGDIKDTEQAIADVRRLMQQVDVELASKLITSDQAAQRRVALQAALNAATDARTQALALTEQSRQMQAGASTLRGGASSLTAINSVKQAIDLRALQAQTQIQLVTAAATIAALEQSITENERVMEVAKTSPYFRALRESVQVAFVPYENLGSVKINMPVYDCYLKVIICRKVGEVVRLYDAEEYARHPLFKTDMKGRLAEIKFEDSDSEQSQVVFVGDKPLFL